MEGSVPASTSKLLETVNDSQMIRITSHGKMKPWIAFALNVIEEKGRPVVLHTLPAPPTTAAPAIPTVPPEESQQNVQPQPQPRGALSNATTTVPRLISIAEIIKREYVKVLEAKHSPRLEGLHQYNEIGCLEDLGSDFVSARDEGESTRAEEIVQALSGRNHIKQRQTPYMKITLSESLLPELVTKGATYQPPAVRKLTKSAKVRAKKRARKAQGQGVQNQEGNDAEETEDVGGPLKPEKGTKRARVAGVDKEG